MNMNDRLDKEYNLKRQRTMRKTSRLCDDMMWCALIEHQVKVAVKVIVLSIVASIILGAWYAYTH